MARLRELHEQDRPEPWSIDDAPDAFIRAELKGIVGLRLPTGRLEGKRKTSQNRPEADRRGVAAWVAARARLKERLAASRGPL
ncbi:MAG: FMN-binding negative transcriptional regulator [Elioraea sp.]|nr:FMN-binding negative transcriptional regulator [Elioraea sp.]